MAACGESPETTGKAPAPPAVETANPLKASVPLFFEVNGEIEATATVSIRARVEAFVNQIAFEPGTEVAKGDLLFQLDQSEINQKIQRAKAGLADAQAQLEKAQLDVSRFEPLAKERAIPQQDLINAKAATQRGEAAVEAANAELEQAKLNLEYTEIHAPLSGLIGDKLVDVGDFVGRGEPTLLATITPVDPIWVSGTITEAQFLTAQQNKKRTGRDLPIYLVLPDGSIYDETGHIVFIDSAINRNTGSLRFRAEFPNPHDFLRPGQFVRIRVLVREISDALLLPQRAIQEIQGQKNVWVVDANNAVSFRQIQTGPRIDSLWVVTDGLQATDQVIIEGHLKIRPGIQVSPTRTEIDPGQVEEYRRERLPSTEN